MSLESRSQYAENRMQRLPEGEAERKVKVAEGEDRVLGDADGSRRRWIGYRERREGYFGSWAKRWSSRLSWFHRTATWREGKEKARKQKMEREHGTGADRRSRSESWIRQRKGIQR
jgi:hypothetical protein